MRSNCNNYYYVTLKTLDSIDEETLELLLTAISKISPDLFAVLQKISTKRFNLKRNK